MTLSNKVRLIKALISGGYNLIDAFNATNGANAQNLFNEYLGVKTIKISDLFIGNFGVTQRFGQNPKMYQRFGWKGHNGIDFGTPYDTQLISCVYGLVIRAYNDSNGWGNHIYIYDKNQSALVIYAHLKSISVKVGQTVIPGMKIGLSDNTGNSTGPHLHFGIYKTNSSGYKINLGNGFGGAIDPFDKKQVSWVITNLKKAL